jgi:ribonucleoside-diphosphate reductase subunit M2
LETISCVKQKADWAMCWIVDESSMLAKHLAAFAIVEGIFFSISYLLY